MNKHYYRLHRREHRSGVILRFIDGLEGGFAIFAGIVAGLSFTDIHRDSLIATAWVGIIVNAVNAATIRYSTEHYYDELDGHEKRSRFRAYFVPAIIDFAIYLCVSALSLLPLLFIRELSVAVITMIAMCLTILFTVGALRGKLLNGKWLRDGSEILFGGAIMISVGAMAGWVLAYTFGH